MSKLLEAVAKKSLKSKVPNLKTGYHVKVHQKIKEGNKERVQIFEGLIIKSNSGGGVNESFTVRKVSGGIGVEKVFLIHSPSIVKIEVMRAHKVRRAKLHFLRDLSGKALRLKEVPLNLTEKEYAQPEAKKEVVEETAEEPKAEVAAETPTPEATEEPKAAEAK